MITKIGKAYKKLFDYTEHLKEEGASGEVIETAVLMTAMLRSFVGTESIEQLLEDPLEPSRGEPAPRDLIVKMVYRINRLTEIVAQNVSGV